MGRHGVGTRVAGTIKVDAIKSTREQVEKIVTRYGEINKEVAELKAEICNNWVGKGRSEYESQYEILISKIDDFGDTLVDIYNALIEAQAEYDLQDQSLQKELSGTK